MKETYQRLLDFHVRKGHLDEVQRLLNFPNSVKIDVNTQLSVGEFTPLMRASRSGNLDMINLLLDHGANLRLTDANGLTAMEIAQNSGHLQVAERLKQEPERLKKLRIDEIAEGLDLAEIENLPGGLTKDIAGILYEY